MGETQPIPRSLQRLSKMAIDLRLILLLTAMAMSLWRGAERPVLGLMLVASYFAIGLLLWWDRVVGHLLARPSLFILDFAVTVLILVAAGTTGPFVLYAVSTAFLAGVLYGRIGGSVFGLAIAAMSSIIAFRDGATLDDLTGSVIIPILIVVAGIGAASVRQLVLQTEQFKSDLADMTARAATAQERARLAREMHDTLGKTLYGVSMAASLLPEYVERFPDEAVKQARMIASSTEVASKEARVLMSDLRSDSLNLPLHEAIEQWVTEWAAESRIEASLALNNVGEMSSSSRYEMFTIVRESLRNVSTHSGATRVSVYLARAGGNVCVEVADNGKGLPSTDLDALAAEGHYGLVGMAERARRAGGQLTIDSRPGATTIRAEAPATSSHDMVPSTVAENGGAAPDSPVRRSEVESAP
ncbi:sensor histidine kinase [Euzebya tangerina]|uniref:sensor histidine kinase n=1 Tax=Euzebya tangerina TaxID=591198 RepID=UPI000E321121|nr:sensor histidine kinase [Euzebya tangerina]